MLLGPDPAYQLFGLAVRLVIAAGLTLVMALVAGFLIAVVFRTVECVREERSLFGHESLDDPRAADAPSRVEGELLQPCVE